LTQHLLFGLHSNTFGLCIPTKCHYQAVYGWLLWLNCADICAALPGPMFGSRLVGYVCLPAHRLNIGTFAGAGWVYRKHCQVVFGARLRGGLSRLLLKLITLFAACVSWKNFLLANQVGDNVYLFVS
jgi:hypothetical protein